MDKELEEVCVYLEGLDNEVDAAYVRNLFKDLYIDIERLQEEIKELQVYHTGSLVCKERHAAQRCTEIIQSVTKLKHRYVESYKESDMSIDQALNETNLVRCKFKSDGKDECDKCDKPILKDADVFYNRTSYEYNEGEYYCETCAINWAKYNATEEYDCPTCGAKETKFVGYPDSECFDCYANRSGMPT